jgi:hypothetical protein
LVWESLQKLFKRFQHRQNEVMLFDPIGTAHNRPVITQQWKDHVGFVSKPDPDVVCSELPLSAQLAATQLSPVAFC